MSVSSKANPVEQSGRRPSGKAVGIHRRPIFWIVLSALVVRLAFSFHMPPSLEGDAGYYHHIAINLAKGNGYALGDERPTRLRPPTYPVLVALVYIVSGNSIRAVAFLQAFVGALTVLLVYLLACRVFDRRAGLLAALVSAFYPALVYYDSRILRESLTAMLLTAIVLLSIHTAKTHRRPRRLLAIGVLFALLSMCRVEALILIVPIGYLLFRPISRLRSLWRPALLVALPVLLAWTPWTVRNYIVFGSLSPVTAGLGSVLWFGSRWAEIGGDDHTPEARAALQKKSHALQDTTEAQIDRRFMAEAVRDIARRPGWFLGMVYRKLIMFWKDANGTKKTLPAIHPRLADLVNAYYYLLLALALVGVAIGARRREWVLPLTGVVLTFMMTYALLHVRNRYRVPVLPLVFVLSAGGLRAVYDLLRTQLRGRIGASADGRRPPGPLPEGNGRQAMDGDLTAASARHLSHLREMGP